MRPNTEDFLTFLCFRGTPVLPSHLNYFNTNKAAKAAAAAAEAEKSKSAEEKESTTTTAIATLSATDVEPPSATPEASNSQPSSTVLIPNKTDRKEDEAAFIPFAVRKQAETVSDGKRRQAVQALKKKYQDQRIAKTQNQNQNQNLNKSALKNRVTRSGGGRDDDESVVETDKDESPVSTPEPKGNTRKTSLRGQANTSTTMDDLDKSIEASSPASLPNISSNKNKAASVADSCEQDSVKTAETSAKKQGRGRTAKKEVNHMPTRLTRQHASAYPESYRLAEEAELKSIQMTVKETEKSNRSVGKTHNDSVEFSSDDDRPLVKTLQTFTTSKRKKEVDNDSPIAKTIPTTKIQPEKGIFEASPEPLNIESPAIVDEPHTSKKKISPVKKSKIKRRTTSVEQSDELKIIIKTTAESVDSASMASNEAPVTKKLCTSKNDGKDNFIAPQTNESIVNELAGCAFMDIVVKDDTHSIFASASQVNKEELVPVNAPDTSAEKPKITAGNRKKRRNEFTDLVQNAEVIPEPGPSVGDTRIARPSRKTKEAAAIYMELIGQKLNFDEFDDDNGSMDSFPELPNVRKTQQMENELKAMVGKERSMSQETKYSSSPKKTKKSNHSQKQESDDGSTNKGAASRRNTATAKRKIERKSITNQQPEVKDENAHLEKSFSESDEEPLAIKVAKKDDQNSVPDVISISSKTDENTKDPITPVEPLLPPPQTPQSRNEESRVNVLKTPSPSMFPQATHSPYQQTKYDTLKPIMSIQNPSPPLGYPRTPSYQPSPFKTPGESPNVLSPPISVSPMVSSKEDSRNLKSPLPQSPSNVVPRSPFNVSANITQALPSPGSTQSVSAILANLMPSKEESGKIFGIASVTLAQSSGPNDTKCTLGKCGSVHKPPLGPVVPTETIILNDQMTSKERRKAKVNMTHDQIQKWLADCSVNQELVDDLLGLDLTQPLIPIDYLSEPSPLREGSDQLLNPIASGSGSMVTAKANKLSNKSPPAYVAKDSPHRSSQSPVGISKPAISKAKTVPAQTVTKDECVASNKTLDENNSKDIKVRHNTPLTTPRYISDTVVLPVPDKAGNNIDVGKLNTTHPHSTKSPQTPTSKPTDAPKSKAVMAIPTTPKSSIKASPRKVPAPAAQSSQKSSTAPKASPSTTVPSISFVERKTPIYNPKRTPVYNTKPIDIHHKSKAVVNSFGAFSPENESSIYSFDKDDDFSPSSTPFRRNRGNEAASAKSDKSIPAQDKSRKTDVTLNTSNPIPSTSTSVTPTTKKPGQQEVSLTLSPDENSKSASIAVQVSMDLASLPKKKPSDGNDSDTDAHTFYIPLQGTNITGSKSDQLIQGVAVKLGTEGPEGPNQRVIMHAKLVTKAQMGSNTTPIPESLGNVHEIVKSLMASKEAAKMVPVGTVQPRFKSSENLSESLSPTAQQQPSGSGMSRHNSNTSLHSQKTRLPQKQPRFKNEVPIQPSNNTAFPRHDDPAQMVEAPVFRPTEKEFADPMEFFDRISPIAARFGLCRVIPPASFKPECKISDDMRFTSYNQYVHKMLHRWGPSAKEFSAIKKYLATQSVQLIHPPWIGGMEVDLPRLYHTVQELGGLREVIEKKKWARVAEEMCFPKTAQDRVSKLDDIYCKYLLPYDTLSPAERQKLFDEVEADWAKTEAKARRNADRTMLSDAASNEDDEDDEDSENEEEEEDGGSMECIVEGRKMPLKQFFRIARNTMSLWFKNTEPASSEIEAEFWRHVAVRDSHVCVHSGSIDSSGWGYGFPTPGPKAKGSTCGKNPWNLKVLTNNHGSILRSIGPVTGVTVPTLHVGMLFSACCWYRDPHGLPWIEYLHTGGSKIWYGVPDEQSANFRSAFTSLVPTHCQNKTVWLPCDTAMVPPHMLTDRGVSLCRAEQEPGQFVIVFPRAYTSSLGTGYTISESVYFATNNWLDTAKGDFKVKLYSTLITTYLQLNIIFVFLGYSR